MIVLVYINERGHKHVLYMLNVPGSVYDLAS